MTMAPDGSCKSRSAMQHNSLDNHGNHNWNGDKNNVAFVPSNRKSATATLPTRHKIKEHNFIPVVAVEATAQSTATAEEGNGDGFFLHKYKIGHNDSFYKVEHYQQKSMDREDDHEDGQQEDHKDHEQLEPNEKEPYVYNLPSKLSPTYRPIPILTQAWIGLFSFVTSVMSHQFPKVTTGRSYGGKIHFIKFIFRVIVTSTFSTIFIQESLFSPSRVDTPTLIKRQWLPSPLSKFSTVTAQIDPQLVKVQQPKSKVNLNSEECPTHIVGPMGVHYLQYDPPPEDPQGNSGDDDNDHHHHDASQSKINFDAIHFNHGFGASSLSWLPAIPSLVNKLGAKVGIAHDAVGFGFTDRPSTSRGKRNSLVSYSSAGTAALGNALLLDKINYSHEKNEQGGNNYVSPPPPPPTTTKNVGATPSVSTSSTTKTVALFGHSMGCAATLRMALSLPRDIKKVIVLVAPALLGSTPPSIDHDSNQTPSSSLTDDIFKGVQTKVKNTIGLIVRCQPVIIRTWTRLFITSLRKVILDSPLMFILKRVVA